MGPQSSRILWFASVAMIASSGVLGWTAYSLRDLPDHIGAVGHVSQEMREVTEARALREGTRGGQPAGTLPEVLDASDADSLEELHASEARRRRERSRLLSDRRRSEHQEYQPAEEGVQDFAAMHREEPSEASADWRDPRAAYDGDAPIRRSAIVRGGRLDEPYDEGSGYRRGEPASSRGSTRGAGGGDGNGSGY